MPAVMRHDGYRLFFYSHKPSEPPHVHVDRIGATAKVWLELIMIASSAGFTAANLKTVLWLVRVNPLKLAKAWHDFFDASGHG